MSHGQVTDADTASPKIREDEAAPSGVGWER